MNYLCRNLDMSFITQDSQVAAFKALFNHWSLFEFLLFLILFNTVYILTFFNFLSIFWLYFIFRLQTSPRTSFQDLFLQSFLPTPSLLFSKAFPIAWHTPHRGFALQFSCLLCTSRLVWYQICWQPDRNLCPQCFWFCLQSFSWPQFRHVLILSARSIRKSQPMVLTPHAFFRIHDSWIRTPLHFQP